MAESSRPYPKLMALAGDQHGPEKMVVYFADQTNGMVVHSTIPGLLGTINVFDPKDFEDTDDIVWLTEGPTEPIEQAIEMVNKVRALNDIGYEPTDLDL